MKMDNTIVNYLQIVNIDGSDPLINHAALIFIIVGAVCFFVGGLGCFGAIRESQMLLFWYAFLLVLIMAAEVVAGILALVYRSKIEGNLNDAMTQQIQTLYIPGNSTKAAWDYLQYSMKCCGSNNHTDYEGSAWWKHHRKPRNNTEQVVPDTCCTLINDDYSNPKATNWAKCQKEAKIKVTDSQYYHTMGCHDSLLKWFQTHSLTLMLIGFAVGASQLIGLGAACCLRQALKAAAPAGNKYKT